MDAFNFTNPQSFRLYAWLCAMGDDVIEDLITAAEEERRRMTEHNGGKVPAGWEREKSLAFTLCAEAAHWLDCLPIASPHWPCWDEATSRTLDDVAHDVRRFKGQEVLALWIPLLNEAMDATDYDAVAEALLRRTGRWPPADEEEDE